MTNQETIKHIPIKVIVKFENGHRMAKLVGVDPWLGHHQIDDWVTDFVADEWNNVPAGFIVKTEWIYI